MKELMNKYLKKPFGLITAVLGLVIIIVSSVYLGLSVSVWSDEWGTDIDLNKDFIIFIIIGLGMLISGGYVSYLTYKDEESQMSLYVGYGFGSVVLSLYSLAMIIKYGQKELENKAATLCPYICYLVVGLLVIYIIGVIYYFDHIKKSQ